MHFYEYIPLFSIPLIIYKHIFLRCCIASLVVILDLVPWQGVNKEKSKPKEDSEWPVQTECKVNIAYCLWDLSVSLCAV